MRKILKNETNYVSKEMQTIYLLSTCHLIGFTVLSKADDVKSRIGNTCQKLIELNKRKRRVFYLQIQLHALRLH